MTRSIDPAKVPQRSLSNGLRMPGIGLGTFGSDHVPNQAVAAAVETAIGMGYRHIDCASVYGNEKEIGEALARCFASKKAQRHQLWITSKLWNDKHSPDDVIDACRSSLADLQLDYLDLYLVHWPFPNFHPKGCDVSSRSPDAVPYSHEAYMKTWRQMERLVDAGLVRCIGTSNMTLPKMKGLLSEARIRPVANQMELHPHFQQPELFDFLSKNKIQPVGFCPIGSPARPARDRSPEDTNPIEDSVIVEIAQRHGLSPAALCVKWAAQRGQVPIPFSTRAENLYSNLAAVAGSPLSDAEMAAIASVDRNCRLIKGQVFLWQGAPGWQALWDE